MTAKEFVKSKMPNARAERHKQARGKTYWLIRNGRASMWFSCGDTESQAWVSAKKNIVGKS